MSLDVLVEETCRRSALLWVRLGSGPSRAAWHVWSQGCAFLVTGPGEQQLPELAAAVASGPVAVDVVVRSKDTGGRLLRWSATADSVRPGSPEWAVTKELAAKRLNAVDVAGQAQRWATSATVVRLTPSGEVPERPEWEQSPSTLRDDDQREAVRASAAATTGWFPWTLGRRRRRR